MATTITLTINNNDFVSGKIEQALEFFEEELKWDAVMNHRAIQIVFEQSSNVSVLEHNAYKVKWYKRLLTERPEYIYFVIPEQFHEMLNILLNKAQYKNLIKLIQSGELAHIGELPEMDANLKTFILESLEDLTKQYDAPLDLMFKVYHEVASI